MTNKPLVHAALSTLAGKTFATREEVDDAVFEFFGPLQAVFPGQSHREFVDLLIRTGWCVKKLNGSGYTMTLGSPEAQPTPPPTPALTPQVSTTILYPEMQVITEIGSAENGVLSDEYFAMNKPLLDGLIAKGLVELVSNVPTPERQRNDTAIQTAVSRALMEIGNKDYAAAANSLLVAAAHQEKNSKIEMVYTLTEKGRVVRERLGSAIIQL